MSDSLWSHGLQPARLLHPWNSPGKNTLERVVIPFSRGSFQPRDQTQVSCITGRFLDFHLLPLLSGQSFVPALAVPDTLHPGPLWWLLQRAKLPTYICWYEGGAVGPNCFLVRPLTNLCKHVLYLNSWISLDFHGSNQPPLPPNAQR